MERPRGDVGVDQGRLEVPQPKPRVDSEIVPAGWTRLEVPAWRGERRTRPLSRTPAATPAALNLRLPSDSLSASIGSSPKPLHLHERRFAPVHHAPDTAPGNVTRAASEARAPRRATEARLPRDRHLARLRPRGMMRSSGCDGLVRSCRMLMESSFRLRRPTDRPAGRAPKARRFLLKGESPRRAVLRQGPVRGTGRCQGLISASGQSEGGTGLRGAGPHLARSSPRSTPSTASSKFKSALKVRPAAGEEMTCHPVVQNSSPEHQESAGSIKTLVI